MSTEMVLIACKAPNGLVLNLDRYVRQTSDPNNPAVRLMPGARVTLAGWSVAMGVPDTAAENGGYALTPVAKDFWDAWFERNKESSLIADRIILVPHRNAIAQAKEHADVPRMFAPVNQSDRGISPLTTKD